MLLSTLTFFFWTSVNFSVSVSAMACCLTTLLLLYLFFILTITAISIVMALINVKAGVRQLYTDVLLYIFEWGREKLEFRPQDLTIQSVEGPEDEDEDEEIINGKSVVKKHSGSEIKPPVNIIERDESNALWAKLSRKLSVDESGAPLSPGHSHIEGIYELLVRDMIDWTKYGIESIIEDEVTGTFETADLIAWNLLFRRKTLKTNQFSKRIWLISCAGWLLRYVILMPTRVILFTSGLFSLMVGSLLVSVAPIGHRGRFLVGRMLTLSCFRVISRACSLQVNYVGAEENRPKSGGICVCNHTGPVDGLVVGCDNHFAVVGQLFPGTLGKIQLQMGKLGNTIWFDRTEQKDREAVKRRLAEHVKDLSKPPILIFPEGVTVNNTAILEFRKGAFESSDTIYPVAIKYDQRFGDPFWVRTIFLFIGVIYN